ncbi:hypothetical protein NPIL_209141 [Nephila pilipes]|uniref:Uncharacterized protein n=1 Tax=Nephila pilipes TaxID=299642 RepID=A0A8X6QWW9_NEPPI|nr:hypothetical protein NPIL_209141 [Nephila pilipes]
MSVQSFSLFDIHRLQGLPPHQKNSRRDRLSRVEGHIIDRLTRRTVVEQGTPLLQGEISPLSVLLAGKYGPITGKRDSKHF